MPFNTVMVALVLSQGSANLPIKPFLQLGPDDQTGAVKSLVVRWVGPGELWFKSASKPWQRATPLATVETPLGRIKSAQMSGLRPAEAVKYELRQGQIALFSAATKAPKSVDQRVRCAIYGDSGRGLPGQLRVAKAIYASRPDITLHTGDIVYPRGRASEYQKFLFPYLNAERNSSSGVPLIRSVVGAYSAGNHDTAYRKLADYPDGLAYYDVWWHPGVPPTHIRAWKQAKKLDAATNPGNFAFAYGAAWWVFLDANTMLNWKSQVNQDWLNRTLAKGRKYPWRFVVWHQPPYHSSNKKKDEVYMKSVLPLLTKHRVQFVFNGHVHNYQRSRPIEWLRNRESIDVRFDGQSVTRSNGTIFIVTGAGGAELYDQALADKPLLWKPFTAAYKRGYSFTQFEFDATSARLRQVDPSGKVIDEIQRSP